MKKIFYLKNSEKLGPVSLDEILYGPNSEQLKSQITEETLVAVNDSNDWITAKEEIGLRRLFTNRPSTNPVKECNSDCADKKKDHKPTINSDRVDFEALLETNSASKERTRNTHLSYLSQHWRGDLSLPLSFWINSICSLALFYFFVLLVVIFNEEKEITLYLGIANLFILPFLLIWLFVGIWRSSKNHELRKSSFSSRMARFSVLLCALVFTVSIFNKNLPAFNKAYKHSQRISSITWDFQISDNLKELEIVGGINDGLAKEVSLQLKKYPSIQYIHLNLERGGLISEAVRVADVLRNRSVSTVVSGRCVSACTLIFLSGKSKYLKKYARLGFHSGSSPKLTNSAVNDVLGQMYKSLGLDDKFIQKVLSVDSSDMWYPSMTELKQAGIVLTILNDDDLNLMETEKDPVARALRSVEKRASEIDSEENFTKAVAGRTRLIQEAKHGMSFLHSRAASTKSKRFLEILEQRIKIQELVLYNSQELSVIFEGYYALNHASPSNGDTSHEKTMLKNACPLLKESLDLMKKYLPMTEEAGRLISEPIVQRELYFNDSRPVEAFLFGIPIERKMFTSEVEAFGRLCQT